jgi:DNA uptake protein ComE-like DNA-binding protein
MADAAKKAAPAPFLIENVVRRQGTRLHRARSATRHRFKQFIGGKRILRNQKLPLNEAEFRANEKQVVEMLHAGVVAVHTPDGIRITTLPDGRYVLTKKTGAVKVLDKGEVPSCFTGGSAPLPKAAPTPAPQPKEDSTVLVEKAEPDDLTELPGIGAGRAKKLLAEGIDTFAKVVDVGAGTLAEIFNVPEDTAAEMVAAAKERR